MIDSWGYDETLIYAIRGTGTYDKWVWISGKWTSFELTALCEVCFRAMTGVHLDPGEYCTFEVN